MRSIAPALVSRFAKDGRKLPTLEELCVQSAIDNLQYLSDVGETDIRLLAKILPHCTPEQLDRIETCSDSRDLSPVTNELWLKFYTKQFGQDSVNLVIERMKKKKLTFKWHLLYKAKMKEQEEIQQRCVDRLKQLYKKADNEKQSRQTQLCTKVPPASKKRSFFESRGSSSSSNLSNVKGRLMKKARMEFAATRDAKVVRPIQYIKPPIVPPRMSKSNIKSDSSTSQRRPGW